MATFYVQNFGCRATQADGAAIERQLIDGGLNRASVPQDASVVVLNTCTVTASADQDVRNAIRRVHRHNPDARILVTGCYAQRAPEEIAAIPGVTWVVGNSHKAQVPEIVTSCHPEETAEAAQRRTPSSPGFVPLGRLSPAPQVLVGDIFAHTELLAAPVFDSAAADRTRPNLKVQDGCDNRCSFCIIPSVRGRSRSLALDHVLRQVDQLVGAGYREIVLSGINLGRWGRDFRRPLRFEQLITAILQRTAIEKLRLSSVEPMDWSDELIDLVAASPRIAKHVHAPLQSGSDRVLRRMHRKYRPWHYEERIRKVRARMPGAAIGADVMVGFPGETDAEFEQNRRFIASLPFTYLHVFTYSSRPGTPSASIPEQVPPQVMRERNRILRDLAAQKNLEFRHSFLGTRLAVITLDRQHADEPDRHPGQGRAETARVRAEGSAFTEGLTDNYLKLSLSGSHAPNQWLTAEITSISGTGLAGKLATSD